MGCREEGWNGSAGDAPGGAGTEGRWRAGAPERERVAAALAAEQHGVVARHQLLGIGFTARMIQRRVEAGRLHALHRGVYAVGHEKVTMRGHWLAAVLACGAGAVLSHRSAGALMGLMGSRGPIEVSGGSARRGRGRQGILHRESPVHLTDRTALDAIPVTTGARTLLDLAGVLGERQLERVFEEASRLRVASLQELEDICARGRGRRGVGRLRGLVREARAPEGARSELEARVLALCREHGVPMPVTGVTILGREVDALWPRQRLVVEADGFAFHGHRAAFERDRERDAAMQVEGYRVIRLTYRRLAREPAAVATQLRRLLREGGAP